MACRAARVAENRHSGSLEVGYDPGFHVMNAMKKVPVPYRWVRSPVGRTEKQQLLDHGHHWLMVKGGELLQVSGY